MVLGWVIVNKEKFVKMDKTLLKGVESVARTQAAEELGPKLA